MKFGLGKGLSALIPNRKPEEEEEDEVVVTRPSDLLEWNDELKETENEEVVEVLVDNNDSDVDLVEEKPEETDDVFKFSPSSFEEVDEEITEADVIKQIPTENIIPNPFQPRKIFKPSALQELADSISEHGIIQPLIVTKRDDGVYELLAGERRLQASKLLGLKTVPAVIRGRKITDSGKLEMALIENLQREDLNIVETARAYQRLHEDFGLSHEQIGMKVGKSRSAISNTIRLLQLPVEFQRALMDGKIAEGHGRALLQVADRERQFVLYEMIQNKKLGTDQAFLLSKQWTARPHLRKDTAHIKFSVETKALEDAVKKVTGLKGVKVSLSERGGGRVEILFLSNDDYEHLMEVFGG